MKFANCLICKGYYTKKQQRDTYKEKRPFLFFPFFSFLWVGWENGKG
jgi:hypothetical protein